MTAVMILHDFLWLRLSRATPDMLQCAMSMTNEQDKQTRAGSLTLPPTEHLHLFREELQANCETKAKLYSGNCWQ